MVHSGSGCDGDGKIPPSFDRPDIADTGIPLLIRSHAVDPGKWKNYFLATITCLIDSVRFSLRALIHAFAQLTDEEAAMIESVYGELPENIHAGAPG